MATKITRRGALFAAAAALMATPAWSAESSATRIEVSNMHCANCAKRMARKLYTVPGVKNVTTDVKSGTAAIVGQSGKVLSPKALWEAVEGASFKIVKLSGPSGEFNTKPKIVGFAAEGGWR